MLEKEFESERIPVPIIERHYLDIPYPNSETIKEEDIVIGLREGREHLYDVARVIAFNDYGLIYDIMRKDGGYDRDGSSFDYLAKKPVVFLREDNGKLEVVAATGDITEGLDKLFETYLIEISEKAMMRRFGIAIN
ncbi:hypothetical protein J4221_04160 [Candidatus Pacearchaeota archaeon]|nr:hypothetical protein [Candidatus Pacearchaeota archaeon]